MEQDDAQSVLVRLTRFTFSIWFQHRFTEKMIRQDVFRDMKAKGAGAPSQHGIEKGQVAPCYQHFFVRLVTLLLPRLLHVGAKRPSTSTSIPQQGTGTMRIFTRERDIGIALSMEWHLSSPSLPARRRSWSMPRKQRLRWWRWW